MTVVYDPSALADEEKAKVVAAVKAANPTATVVQVQADGSVVVTFADGSSANLTAAQTIKDGSLVAKPCTNRAARATASTETRASDGAQNLDYTNKEDVEGCVKINYEVDKAKNVIHWIILDNPGRKGNSASGYVYFTIPKDSVGEPTNWSVVQTDKNGKVVNSRNYWKNNDGVYLMSQNGRMNTYTGAETTKRLTQLYKDTKNPAIRGNEAAVAAQTAERSQALYTMTADNNAIRNVMWTITFDTPILDKSMPLDYVAGIQGTGVVGGRTNIMTGFTDNFIDDASSKFQAVAVKEKYTAKVGGSFNADPSTYVTNQTGTPAFPNNYRGATTFAWKDGEAPTATTPGTHTKTVVVTYPEYYKQDPQEVTITFEVQNSRSDADKNDPTAKAQTVTAGSTPNAQDSIGNVSDLPSGTTYEFKTPVDTATDGEKDATVVVTYPDGSKDEVPIKVTVKTPSTDADNNKVTDPAVTPVTDPSNLTDAEKAKVADEVKKANPTAKDINVNKDGSVVVTFKDDTTAVIPADKTVKKSADKVKESDGVKNPTVTPVTDPSNLTNAEKAKVADEVKKANPTAKDIKVNNDGSVVVTFVNGSVAVIASENTFKEATKESSANPTAKKAGAKELPNTGTKQSSASLALALLAAATGGLLIAKKREEEE